MSNGRYQERGGSRGGGEDPSVTDQVVKEIGSLKTLSMLETDKLVDLAEKMGDFLANQIRLKTSQIRKFLDAVNEIKSKGTQDTTCTLETLQLRPLAIQDFSQIRMEWIAAKESVL